MTRDQAESAASPANEAVPSPKPARKPWQDPEVIQLEAEKITDANSYTGADSSGTSSVHS